MWTEQEGIIILKTAKGLENVEEWLSSAR